MAKINFVTVNKSIEVENGTTILEAARKIGVIIESPCDAIGTCGKCKVKVDPSEIQNIIYKEDRHSLTNEEHKKGYVLSCGAKVIGDISVETPLVEGQNKTLKILSDGQTFDYEINPLIIKKFDGVKTKIYAGEELIGEEEGNTEEHKYGLTIDIGTTTLVVALIDMNTGEEITSLSSLNPQSLHAQDVLTRIKFSSSDEGLSTMYKEIIDEFNRMITDICKKTGINKDYIYEAVYSGNTTMIHIAANISPKSLGSYPYTPILNGGSHISAKDNGLNISKFGVVYFPPIISAFVGPDITSGVLATRMQDEKGINLLIDIGTNGEMIISREGLLSSTSTAAGPAFEGMNITFGMRAGKGAIEYFNIEDNGHIKIKTIEDAEPIGICGSGLFDIVGELVRAKVIGSNGKFAKPENLNVSDEVKERIVTYEGKTAFEVAKGVYLTLKDVRQVQLAKGAVRAGVEALLASQDVTVENVDKVLIAGSFGYHLRAESLVNVALLPKELGNKVEFVGNTSKTGGSAFLLNTLCREEMKTLVSNIKCVELANMENFDRLFVGSLGF